MGAVVVAMAVLLIPGIERMMRRVGFRTAVARFLQRYNSPATPDPDPYNEGAERAWCEKSPTNAWIPESNAMVGRQA
jgi:hypothetical protein